MGVQSDRGIRRTEPASRDVKTFAFQIPPSRFIGQDAIVSCDGGVLRVCHVSHFGYGVVDRHGNMPSNCLDASDAATTIARVFFAVNSTDAQAINGRAN